MEPTPGGVEPGCDDDEEEESDSYGHDLDDFFDGEGMEEKTNDTDNNTRTSQKKQNANKQNDPDTLKNIAEETRHYYIEDIGRLRKIIDDLIQDKKDLQQRIDFLTKKVEQYFWF